MADSVAVRAVLLVAVTACGGGALAPDAPATDAPLPWATFTIPPGAHDAEITGGRDGDPVTGFMFGARRSFDLALDPSAMYVLTTPTEPEDQLDWNKLPGFSDCGGIDLAVDGAMFGWRWRTDLEVVEVTAYANNAGVHLTPDEPLLTLDAAALAARTPVHYELTREAAQYRFSADGHAATLPRRCTDQPVMLDAWAGELYFGGTSVAPQTITATIREH